MTLDQEGEKELTDRTEQYRLRAEEMQRQIDRLTAELKEAIKLRDENHRAAVALQHQAGEAVEVFYEQRTRIHQLEALIADQALEARAK